MSVPLVSKPVRSTVLQVRNLVGVAMNSVRKFRFKLHSARLADEPQFTKKLSPRMASDEGLGPAGCVLGALGRQQFARRWLRASRALSPASAKLDFVPGRFRGAHPAGPCA
jgi:hypothetical protein